jgi:hypothetical protein
MEWKLDKEWNWLAKGIERETRLYAPGVAGWSGPLRTCSPIRSARGAPQAILACKPTIYLAPSDNAIN